jgi:hypothetical protein
LAHWRIGALAHWRIALLLVLLITIDVVPVGELVKTDKSLYNETLIKVYACL